MKKIEYDNRYIFSNSDLTELGTVGLENVKEIVRKIYF